MKTHRAHAQRTWKVGLLAKETGVSVRALHHYDAIGLLRPSLRSRSGHRLYTEGDLRTLHRIVTLRSLGWSLDAIADSLTTKGADLRAMLDAQRARLRDEIASRQRLAATLDALVARLGDGREVDIDCLLHTIEATAMINKHYTPEQLEQLRQRREALGDEAIQNVEAEWPKLMAEVGAAMDAGTDPKSPAVVAMAHRWNALIAMFTGGDPGIRASLDKVYRDEDPAAMHPGMPDRARMSAMSSYLRSALD